MRRCAYGWGLSFNKEPTRDSCMKLETVYRDSAENDAIVAWDVGMSEADVAELLKKNPTYYRSTTEVSDCDARLLQRD